MPLVAHTGLPTFQRLLEEGEDILNPSRASHQHIRELHIGLLNIMPDSFLDWWVRVIKLLNSTFTPLRLKV